MKSYTTVKTTKHIYIPLPPNTFIVEEYRFDEEDRVWFEVWDEETKTKKVIEFDVVKHIKKNVRKFDPELLFKDRWRFTWELGRITSPEYEELLERVPEFKLHHFRVTDLICATYEKTEMYEEEKVEDKVSV